MVTLSIRTLLTSAAGERISEVSPYLLYIYIYIYNSVLTYRQNIINSSASAPLNATKIAVKKVGDVDLCMFGPEL